MATTDAQKVTKYREMAKDTSLPQDVRNMYLDKANELEYKNYEAGKKAGEFKKGGMVKQAMAKGGAVKKPVAKKAMAKGGMAKKGKC